MYFNEEGIWMLVKVEKSGITTAYVWQILCPYSILRTGKEVQENKLPLLLQRLDGLFSSKTSLVKDFYVKLIESPCVFSA